MARAAEADLALILAEGEGQVIEFKERLSRLDRVLVAFANANGGSVFLRDIKHLLRAGVIERRGTGRATRYVLAG